MRRLLLALALVLLVGCAAQKAALVLPTLGERAHATTGQDGSVCYSPMNAVLLRGNLETLQAREDAMLAALAAAGVVVTFEDVKK